MEIGHQSKKTVTNLSHRWTCRCSSLGPSPERPSPCLKSHLNNFPFLKNHLKFGNQMQKQVLFTTICETDDMRRTFITCPMFSPVRTNPAAVSKPFFHRNIPHYIPFKQLKKLGVTCKLWEINPLTLKPRKIIMWKHHDLAYGIFIGTLLHDNRYHDDVWYDLDPLLLGTPQNKLAASPSTPKRSSLWLPGWKTL